MIIHVCCLFALICVPGITENMQISMGNDWLSETKENHSNFEQYKLLYQRKSKRNLQKENTNDMKGNAYLKNNRLASKNQSVLNVATSDIDTFKQIIENIIQKNVTENDTKIRMVIDRHLLPDIINDTNFEKLERRIVKEDDFNNIFNNSHQSLRKLMSTGDALSDSKELFIGSDGYLDDRKPIISNLSYENHSYEIMFSSINEILKIFNRELPIYEKSFQESKDDFISLSVSREMNASNFQNVSISWYKELTENFNCFASQKENFSLTCNDVLIYSLAKCLPSTLEKLDISNSPTPLLLKPLFPHLKHLKYLRFFNNQHRYITKAFMGLESLEYLDLSNNDIMAIKAAFTPLTNLKSLNLTGNEIISVHLFTEAVSSLKYLEILTFDHNWRIRRITRKDLEPLINCNIKRITFVNTTMINVEKGAFEYLPKLRDLEVSVNYLNEESITNITSSLANSSIERLYLRQCTLMSKFPAESLSFLENTSLYDLNLSNNYFPSIPKIPKITSLRNLWLQQSKIYFVSNEAFSQLPNLTELVINENYLTSVFNTTPLMSLKVLIIYDQLIKFDNIDFPLKDHQFKNMENLKILDMSRNIFPGKLRRYWFYGLHSLTYLKLVSVGIGEIEDFAFESLQSLNVINLGYNKLSLLTNYTFYGLFNLTDLYLSANWIKFLPNVYPFHPTLSLKNILLDHNKIDTFPGGLFYHNPNLEILVCSRNFIRPWSKRILHHNSNLTILGLARNVIDTVTPVMLSEFRQITSYIDVSKNALNCNTCGMIEFQDFLNSSNLSLGLPIEAEPGYFSLVCTIPKSLQNTSFLEATLPLVECSDIENKISDLSFITLALLLSIFVAGTSFLCYFFRWYVRYYIFCIEVKVKRRSSSYSKSGKLYKYDAFVSYNSNDIDWIVTNLIPALEQEDPKLKLCIHERDFQVGRLITENILEAIENSKAVVLILTEEFIKSEWCMFELHMAQHRLFNEKRDSLILVKLKKVPKNLYTTNLSYLEKTRICLKWPDDLAEQKLFWNKLRKNLGISQISNECMNKEVVSEA